jgi:hypothetical protein
MKKPFIWALTAAVLVWCSAPLAYAQQEMSAKQFVDEVIAWLGKPLPANARDAVYRGVGMHLPKTGWYTFPSSIGDIDCTLDTGLRGHPIKEVEVNFDYRDDHAAIANFLTKNGWRHRREPQVINTQIYFNEIYEKDGVRASGRTDPNGAWVLWLRFLRFASKPEESAPGGGIRITPSAPEGGFNGGFNPGGAPNDLRTVTPPNFGVPYPQIPLGGGSSGNGLVVKECSLCKGTGTSPIKESAPYYGGERSREWCDTCGDFSYPHWHKKCPSCDGAGRIRASR